MMYMMFFGKEKLQMPVVFLTSDAFILMNSIYITEHWLNIHLNCPP